MEAAIQTLVKVFLRSSKGKETLGKKEFQGLVKSQLSNILTGTDSNEAVNNMGKGLDADQDGKVGFEEYMKLVGYLAVSLSEQHTLAAEETAENAASGQVAQSVPANEEEKPEANAEVKEEPKVEAKEEPKAEPVAVVKVDGNAEEVKPEVEEEGATKPEEPKKEPEEEPKEEPAAEPTAEATAAVATLALDAEAPAVEVTTTTVKVVTNEEVKVEETVKVEEFVEKVAAAVEEEAEKKTEDATS